MMLCLHELKQNDEISVKICSSDPLKNSLKRVSHEVSKFLSANDSWRAFHNTHVLDLLGSEGHQFRIRLNFIANLTLQVSVAWLSSREAPTLKLSNVFSIILFTFFLSLLSSLTR
jgi:hypothetical protein